MFLFCSQGILMGFHVRHFVFCPLPSREGVPSQQAEARAAVRQFVMGELVTKQDLALALDNATLKLTVRLGAMLAAGIAVLGALLKLA